jgi:hypothetical protein
MTDDFQDYSAVGGRELREEIGLECDPSELIPLSQIFRPNRPFNYIATSHYDEGTYFSLVMKNCRSQIDRNSRDGIVVPIRTSR